MHIRGGQQQPIRRQQLQFPRPCYSLGCVEHQVQGVFVFQPHQRAKRPQARHIRGGCGHHSRHLLQHRPVYPRGVRMPGHKFHI